MRALWAAITLISAATQVAARDPILSFPVDCKLGDDCFIQNYVDADPSAGASDFTCGSLSYDGHDGTDIALISDMAAKGGVNITPVAPGVVRHIRNDADDHFFSAPLDYPDGQECGNGLIVDHGGGWESQYCHLRKGSVPVSIGQKVGLQSALGQIGMSGLTEFPHLHLTLRKNGRVVDPFNADALIYCGGDQTTSLWATEPEYQPSGFVNAGFRFNVPDFEVIKWGQAHRPTIEISEGGLVFWAHLFGAQAGDIMHLLIRGPNGVFVDHTETLTSTQARAMRAVGRKLHQANSTPGTFHGTATLLRNGKVVDRAASSTTLKSAP